MTLEAFPPSVKIGAEDVVRFQEDGTIKVKLNGSWTGVTVEGNAYDELTEFVSVATIGASKSKIIFDASGNLYWSAPNQNNVSAYNQTSYLYKITPEGVISTFASQATNGCKCSDLAFDTSGNLYWAIGNYYNGTTYNLTSYIYKITPAGTKTTFVSQATNGIVDTSLAFDSAGNLYWSIANGNNGTTYNITSYLLKITPAGSASVFASQATTAGNGTSLAFDSDGNIYWALNNYYNGTTYSLTSYVYKVTPAGTKTTFASQATIGGYDSSLIFDTSGNLYWALTNLGYAGNYNQTHYVYKITPAGVKTTFASQIVNVGCMTDLLFDSNNKLFWALSTVNQGGIFSNSTFSSVYKITPAGVKTTFTSQAANYNFTASMAFDSSGNFYWVVNNHVNEELEEMSVQYKMNSYVYTKRLIVNPS